MKLDWAFNGFYLPLHVRKASLDNVLTQLLYRWKCLKYLVC